MHLETPRLNLSPWADGDWERFKPLATDPRVMRFISGGTPWTDDQIRSFIERNRATFLDRGFCRWKLEDKQAGELIGFCGVGFLQWEPDAEIGWWLAAAYWGRGLATEAARVAFQDAKERVRLRRIVSLAHPENIPSIRIMQKLGLRHEKQFEHAGQPVVRYAFDAAANT